MSKDTSFGRDSVYTLKGAKIYVESEHSVVLPQLFCFSLRFQHAMGGVPDWAETGRKRRKSSDG